MKKRIILLLVIAFLVLGIGFTILYFRLDDSRKITFKECENAGGVAWPVDLYHPDICSSCAEYQACEEKNKGSSDIREVCPQIVACTACIENNFPYPDSCPGGRKKVGEISDAATWFQCCK